MPPSQPDLFESIPLSAAGERRLFSFEECSQAINQLYLAAAREKGTEAFTDFIEFVAKFRNLSVYNAMLVKIQRPGAVAVATRRKWGALGGSVNPDAVPIMTLQPFGPVQFVFEVTDVTGISASGDYLASLAAQGDLGWQQYEQAKARALEYSIIVEEVSNYGAALAGTAAALNVLPEATARNWRIRLSRNLDLPTRYATLAHELGHIYCGHLGSDPKGRWPSRRELDTEVAELEAEAVSWLVCQRHDLKPNSPGYLHELATKERIDQVSMYAIYEAANRVEARSFRTPGKGKLTP
jgi:hypothetical protein